MIINSKVIKKIWNWKLSKKLLQFLKLLLLLLLINNNIYYIIININY